MASINPYTSIQQTQRPEFPSAITQDRFERSPPQRGIARPQDNARPPTDLRARLDDLIANEVTTGRLTDNQASDLRSVFNDTFDEAVLSPPPQPAFEPNARPPQPDASVANSPFSIDRSADTFNAPNAATDVADTASVMQKFLDALQASLEASAAATYTASGQNSVASIKTVNPLLVDFRT